VRSSSTPRRRATWTAVAAGALLLLTGCADVHPGVAAKVGDDTITMATVDQAADDLCTGVRPQLGANDVPAEITMGQLRTFAVHSMVRKEIVDQFAADNHIAGPGEEYDKTVDATKGLLTKLPSDVQDTYIEIFAIDAYADGILGQVAKTQLAAAGNTSPSDEQIKMLGDALFQDYVKSLDISIDPRFGIGSDLNAADTTVSYPASTVAKRVVKVTSGKATADEAAEATAALPAAFRCSK